ncbi:MAG: 50S ribosomal protein L25 [Deltaproteobacteria bacterium]|nr:MAG: 50S ribosomal protein L25 [Deltaproteobacteria bacterium]
MEVPVLKVTKREVTGKEDATRLRKQGLVPAVCYGAGKAPMHFALAAGDLRKILQGGRGLNSLIKIEGADEERTVFVQEIQRHPVDRHWVHVDFLYVDPQKPVVRRVPVELEGRPEGVKLGGVLQVARRDIRVECLPSIVPEKIVIDVSKLQIGDSIHVEDVEMPEGVKAVFERNYTICAVVAPTEEEKPAEQAAAGAEEPAAGAAAQEQAEQKQPEKDKE